MKRIVIFVFLFISMPWNAAGQDHDCLKLGVVPYKSPRAIVKLYSPIASLLTRELGKEVRVVTAIGYEQYLQRIYDKQYDIIVLGSTFYFKAHDRSGYEAVARGYPSFRSGIIVRNTSDINDIEQLRGKSLAAVNIMDRGGYKLQERALLKHGIDIDNDLEVHFRGKFDSVIYAVLHGQDDAGAIRLDALQKPDFDNVRKKLKIIYTSPENPQFPFAVRSTMDPIMRERVGAVLASITMEEPESAAILHSLNIQGIKRISSSELELLRQQRLKEEKETDIR
jgi:phosphonate transport system substrate-binding protein